MVIVVATLALVAVLLIVFLQPMFALRALARRDPEVLYFVTTRRKIVALTIDDAPHAIVTPQLLDVLKAYGAHATFFVLGDHTSGNLALLDRARAEGHELGNHLVHDSPTILLSPARFDQELADVDRLIGPFAGIKWFRPVSGWYNARMLNQAKRLGYRCALGSVYPFDPLIRNAWAIATYIKRRVFPGAVIIIHDGTSGRVRSVDVLREILPALMSAGYRIATLSELVADAASSPVTRT